MRYAQIVLGPAGSGKTTYCKVFQDYLFSCKRNCYIVNLDPATEDGLVFENDKIGNKTNSNKSNNNKVSPFDTDIRDFVDIGSIIEEEDLGPNGALVRSSELLAENLGWLSEQLESTYSDESYLLFDTPGQIELFLHIPYIKTITELLKRLNINCLAVYLLDVSFMNDPAKLISGSLAGLAAMVNLEMPHINVLSKCDLICDSNNKISRNPFLDVTSSTFGFSPNDLQFQKLHISTPTPNPDYPDFDPDSDNMDYSEFYEIVNKSSNDLVSSLDKHLPRTYKRLNVAFASLLEDFDLVSFMPLNINDEECLEQLLVATDVALQFGEEAEPSAKFDLSDTI
uniref:GPN-loop GTPase 3 n=1 Tax=Theileria annulata TaxID=5874 RepID=A0A3B0MR42_THEAN